MVFDSQTGRDAQAKRKTRGTGAHLKHLQEDKPEEYAEIQRQNLERQKAKYGGEEGYKVEMKRRINLRWKKNG